MKYLKTFEGFEHLEALEENPPSLLDWYKKVLELEYPYDPIEDESNWKLKKDGGSYTETKKVHKREDWDEKKSKFLKELENNRKSWGKDAHTWFQKNVEEDPKIKSLYEDLKSRLNADYLSQPKRNKYNQLLKNLEEMINVKMRQLLKEDEDMYDVLMVPKSEKSSLFVDWMERKYPRKRWKPSDPDPDYEWGYV